MRRSWIGLDVQPLLKSSPVSSGALVGGTIEGSPAAKAGFQPGDIVTRVGNEQVSVKFAEEIPLFNQAIMRLPLGKPSTWSSRATAPRGRSRSHRRSARASGPHRGAAARRHHRLEPDDLVREGAEARQPRRRSRSYGARRPAARPAGARQRRRHRRDRREEREERRSARRGGRAADEGQDRSRGRARRVRSRPPAVLTVLESAAPGWRIPASKRERPGSRCRFRS